MLTDANQPMLPVTLSQRVILADGVVFDAEREVGLPIPPFVGLQLYNTHWRSPGDDESEEPIEAMAYDLKTGRLVCYLPVDDYRAESIGSADWTEDDVRERYQDWVLQPDKVPKARGEGEWNGVAP
jgi:hypothetical protein